MITINNVKYPGNSISINNGKVMVDGKDCTPIDEKVITIEVTGNIDKLDVDTCQYVKVTGDCNKVKTMSGDVEVGRDILGNVKTMSGDITSAHIEGSVSTMSGDITTH